MPTPTVITDLSTVIASNFPAGSNAPSVLDDVQRAHAAFIAQLRDNTGFTTPKAASGANTDITSLAILPGYLFGCTLSTAGASATMSIAAGRAQDSTGGFLMQLSAIAKTTAAWAVGTAAGGLDTGAIANSTWYHFHVIRRPDTGVVDVLCSLSATAPTLPANYTQFRRIGSGKTNGSAQWTAFSQNGDEFLWSVAPADISTSAQGGSVILYTLSVPPGVKVNALLSGTVNNATLATQVLFSSGDVPISSSTGGLLVTNTSTGAGTGQLTLRTNTSQQVAVISNVASTTISASTFGWIDTRGRNA